MKAKLKLLGLLLVVAGLGSCDKELLPNEPGNLVPKTVDLDPALPSISVNGTRLHSEAFGNPADPLVIFLHGGPGADYRNGLPVKDLVNHRYYVIFYDQRGSGLSQRHPKDSYSIQVMLDDLTAVITHYRTSPTQKVFLFGHSWGAMLATAYINKYPAAINGIVLAEPGGFDFDQLEEYSENSRRLNLIDEVTNDVLYPDQFLTGKDNEHAILDYKIALSSSFTYAKNNREGIEGPSPFWRNGAAVVKRLFEIAGEEGFDFKNNLGSFSKKVLFLYSENNRAYPLSFAQKLSAAFVNVQLSEVKGTGHEMIWFKWDNVKALTLPYLESLR